ncbi:fimbria/pilus periplasmic chaperone [Escherichia coli]
MIFPSDRKEVSVRVTNSGDMPSLTQAWVDGGTIQNNTGKDMAPFVVLPPIIRVEPEKRTDLSSGFLAAPRFHKIVSHCTGLTC